MRIGIMNTWPNIPQCSEAEWIKRALIACDHLGFDAEVVLNSDDILRLEPDCVLPTDEYSSKLTPFPTIGIMWSPVPFYGNSPLHRRSILSHDGHLCGSHQIADWVADFLTGQGKEPLIHSALMLPSAPDCGPARRLPSDLAIMYIGMNWDGERHGAIFRGLDGKVPLKFYGPPSAWANRGDSYRGLLPFDGISVINALRDAGIALCLHKAAHRAYNCPSTRLFEAAAAGALIITDDFAFPREWFRDSVLYVDTDLPTPLVIQQILNHFRWAQRNPEAATRLAQRSNELFRRSLSLERMFETLPELVDRVRSERHMLQVPLTRQKSWPVVDYIVRIRTESIDKIVRVLESLSTQTYQPIGIILVQTGPSPDLGRAIKAFSTRFESFRLLIVANNGRPSTSLWAGLREVTATHFGLLDDDGELLPNHVATAMATFARDQTAGFVYSGTITAEDRDGVYFEHYHHNGFAGAMLKERRHLTHIEEQDFTNFDSQTNVIGPNAWIARRDALDYNMLLDPSLESNEVPYLLALLASRTRPHFTAMATAIMHRNSTSEDEMPADSSSDIESLRWRHLMQSRDLPTQNRIASLGILYDSQTAVFGDSS